MKLMRIRVTTAERRGRMTPLAAAVRQTFRISEPWPAVHCSRDESRVARGTRAASLEDESRVRVNRRSRTFDQVGANAQHERKPGGPGPAGERWEDSKEKLQAGTGRHPKEVK